jgi:hypothetical protein
MATISNDHDLRNLLDGLSDQEQRIVGARFAWNVIHLCRDDRVRRAAQTALDPGADDTAREDALRAARAHATKTYTDCGKDTDWLAQADHFVAAAVAAALTPQDELPGKMRPAWKAAVQARMAKNCEMMEQDEGEAEGEAERQYRIASESV